MFESFHKFLDRAANMYGISREVQSAKVCHNFRELLTELFADQHASLSEAASLDHRQKGSGLHSNIPKIGNSESRNVNQARSHNMSLPPSGPHLSATPARLDRGPLDKFVSSGSFQDGTLTVDVASPAWAQEILMRRPQIIEALNRKAGRVIVRALRTRVKTSDPTQ